MKISILTIFPEMFEGFLNTSIIKKAILQEFVEVELVDFRAFSKDKHNRVDDTPYGGGAGLVLMYQPVIDALNSVKTSLSHTILLTPAGHVYNQTMAKRFVEYNHLIIICGHYEGFDERILNHVDEVVCIGDYILTGGEIAAMAIADSVIRLIPDVITAQSLEAESFENNLLEYAHYTKPQEIDGFSVPDVLISGHHQKIAEYRHQSALLKTAKYRKDLLAKYSLSKTDKAFLDSVKDEK